MSSSESEQLDLVVQEQKRRELSQSLARDIIADIQNSLLFSLKWEDLLMAAPIALHSLGAIFVAASSTDTSINLEPPRDGFKHLLYPRLHPNLLECGSRGRLAFMDAEKGMGEISSRASFTSQLVKQVISVLMDDSAATELKPVLKQLQKAVDGCRTSAENIHASFDRWLLYAMEIYASCSNTQGATQDALTQAKLDEEKATVSIKSTEASLKVAQETNEVMKSTVKEASDAFKKASDEFPKGWDLLGQQIVSDLAGAVTNLINGKMSESTGQADSPENKDGKGKPAPMDPGHSQVMKDMTYYELLDTIINKGKDGEINWEATSGRDSGSNAISFAAEMLTASLQSFKPQQGRVGKAYRSALEIVQKIARELADEMKKSSSISYTLPDKNDARVQKWKSDFAPQYKTVIELNAVAKSGTGNTKNPSQVVKNDQTPPQKPQKGSHAQMVLEGAKTRLATTQKLLLDSSKNYIESTKLVVDTQAALDAVKARLISISSSVIKLAEIKRVLIDCIRLMIKLQDSISKLVRWFSALSSCIKFIAENQVDPFIEMITRATSDPNKIKLGKITFTDYQRTCIFNGALTIRAYFGIFSDVAVMWNLMSQENIFPGITMVEELAIQSNDDKNQANIVKQKFATLDAWSSKASKNIREIASKKQEDIQADMETRISAVVQTTNMLPASEKVKQAIKDGSEQAQKAQAAANAETRQAAASNLTDF